MLLTCSFIRAQQYFLIFLRWKTRRVSFSTWSSIDVSVSIPPIKKGTALQSYTVELRLLPWSEVLRGSLLLSRTLITNTCLITKTCLPHLGRGGDQCSRIGVLGSPAGIWNSPYYQTQDHWITVFEIIPWSHPTRTKICLVPWKDGALIGPESSCFSLCQCSWCSVVRRRAGETRVQQLCGLGHAFPHLITVSNFPKYWWRWILP